MSLSQSAIEIIQITKAVLTIKDNNMREKHAHFTASKDY